MRRRPEKPPGSGSKRRRPGSLACWLPTFSRASLVLALSTGSAFARPFDWADEAALSKRPEYAASQAICRGLKGLQPPAADAPTAAEAAALADCSSQSLYYGIGRPADAKAARLCAFVEKRTADPQVEDYGFNGDRILMQVYANGFGVARDLDVATALACRIPAAPAESNGRVLHLAKLKAEHWAGTDFSLCDDATSGLMGGICADHRQLVERATQAKTLASLMASWSKDDRTAFAVLDRAKSAFVDARGENEVDQSGSLRAAFVVAAEDKAERAFLALLQDVDAGKLSPAMAADAKAADAALNARYADVVAKAPALFGDSTVTRAGVLSVQRAWLRYRDAWLAFAKRKYPAVSADALLARLSRERTAQLADVPAAQD